MCQVIHILYSVTCINGKWILLVLLGCFWHTSSETTKWIQCTWIGYLQLTAGTNIKRRCWCDRVWRESTPSPTLLSTTQDTAERGIMANLWVGKTIHYHQFSYCTSSLKSWSTLTDSSMDLVFKLCTRWQTDVSEVREKKESLWEKLSFLTTEGFMLWLTLK